MDGLFDRDAYVKELQGRRKKSHVYYPHQLIGLEIAQILDDTKHKTFYMKLAKHYDHSMLMRIAKHVEDSKSVKSRGAVFMHALEEKVGKIKFTRKIKDTPTAKGSRKGQ